MKNYKKKYQKKAISLILTMIFQFSFGQNNKKIIGGQNAAEGQFPWISALYYKTSNDIFIQSCGGSLIAPQWILTAAHCNDSFFENENLTITSAHNQNNISLELYTLQGQKIESKENLTFDKEFKIPIKNLSKNIYILNLRNTKGQKLSQKIIKL